jgi:tetratricopeptide (TPR) repeat protein
MPDSSEPTLPAPLPELGACETAGDELSSKGEHERASEEYKRALFLLGAERSPRRVALYVKLGACARALGKSRVALNNFDRALAILPGHDEAFQRFVEVALETRDFTLIDEQMRRRLDALRDDAEKAALYRENFRLWLEHASDREQALEALRRWLGWDASSREALEHQAELEIALERFGAAVDTLARLARATGGHASAQHLCRAAELALGKLGEPRRALELYLAALDADVTSSEAASGAERLLEKERDHSGLADLYERLSGEGREVEQRLAALRKLAVLCRAELSDLARVESALSRATELAPEDAELFRELAAVQQERGELDEALDHARRAAELEPRDTRAYHRIFDVFQGLGLVDGAYNTALALEYLDDADINEAVLADQYRPEGLLAPRAVVLEEDWARGVFLPDLEPALRELLDLLTPIALERWRASSKKGAAPILDERERQDVASSTATLVRALAWATRVLGVEVPALYLRAEVEGGIQSVLAEPPALVASRALGSGLDLPELAFLWGRSLFALRKEHRIALAFETPEALGAVLDAARAASNPAAKASLPARPELVKAFEKALDAERRERVKGLFAKLPDAARSAESILSAFELGAVRAGLLVSGDPGVASRLSERFPFGRFEQTPRQIDALLAFSVSDAYLGLRRRLGVAVGA